MKFLITLLLILLYPFYTHASTDSRRLIGYLDFPSDMNYWDSTASEREFAALLNLPVDIELYNYPTQNTMPAQTIAGIEELTLTNFTYSIYPSVNVYGQTAGWLLVKTINNHYLWMKHNEVEAFSSLTDVLTADWYIQFERIHKMYMYPYQYTPELKVVEDESAARGYTSLKGYKFVDGELWLELKQELFTHRNTQESEKVNLNLINNHGWLKAHQDNGELAFVFINPC